MLRAIFEGLDYQFLQIVRGFESAVGVRPEKGSWPSAGRSKTNSGCRTRPT